MGERGRREGGREGGRGEKKKREREGKRRKRTRKGEEGEGERSDIVLKVSLSRPYKIIRRVSYHIIPCTNLTGAVRGGDDRNKCPLSGRNAN